MNAITNKKIITTTSDKNEEEIVGWKETFFYRVLNEIDLITRKKKKLKKENPYIIENICYSKNRSL